MGVGLAGVGLVHTQACVAWCEHEHVGPGASTGMHGLVHAWACVAGASMGMCGLV